MELKIDLSDREEIAAAVPLLQLILSHTQGYDIAPPEHKCEGSGQCNKASPFPPIEVSAPEKAAVLDPAAVFGKDAAEQVPPFLQGAPSSVVASQLPTAPVATLATSLTTPSSVPLPPAPPAPGTAAPTVTDAAPMIHADLDKNGLPWDERIHSSSKAKLASGAWKYRRGVEPVEVQQVEAELRGHFIPAELGAAGAFTPLGLVPHLPPELIGQSRDLPLPPHSPEADHQAAIREVAERRALAMADVTNFDQLMPRATAAVVAGKLPIMAVQDACVACGLVSIVALQQNPAAVPPVWAHLKQTYPEL